MMFFFFNDTAATEIYTLSLHDALPISDHRVVHRFLVEALVHQVNASPRRVHLLAEEHVGRAGRQDRKSTRLNSSHANISYAVFCLKKKIFFTFILLFLILLLLTHSSRS